MSLEINLPSDLEAAVRQRAQASGEDVESFLIRQIESTLQKSKDDESDRLHAAQAATGFAERLKRWIDLHPSMPHMDDSRDSIYAGRS